VIACPHCDEKDEDGEKKFMAEKSRRLEEIQTEGKARVQEKKKLALENETLKTKLQELEIEKEPAILSLEKTGEIKELETEIGELEEKTAAAEIPQKLIDERDAAEKTLSEARQTVAAIESNQASFDRVASLEAKIKKLSSEYDDLERFFFLFDQYTQAIARKTEDAVEERFDHVRFRMFSKQINGGIVPVCDILNDELRPYETALSTGERIKIGLDIIKTLSIHYQVSGPIFIDHAESYTGDAKMDCQTIELRASTEHQKLTRLQE
jgi:regulator of replication initiation timing